MKLKAISLIAILLLTLVSCNKEKSTPEAPASMFGKAVVDIIVDYQKQPGHGSNQWAVWVEDEAGAITKTLFVTSFTADGGYVPRPACTPLWVAKADPEGMADEMINAISGATPASGMQTYTWDLVDSEGTPVGDGLYTCYVEATLFGESQVIFKAPIAVGKEEITIAPLPEYTTDDETNRSMIKGVTVNYRLIKP